MNNRQPYRLPRDKAEQIIREAMTLTPLVWCEVLDCSKSWARQPTDKTPDEVIKMGVEGRNTLWNFIYREPLCGQEAYFDVGLCTIAKSPDYFLWIKLGVLEGEQLIKKYKLK